MIKRDDEHVEKVLDHLVLFYQRLKTTDMNGLHPFHLPIPIANQVLKHVEHLLLHYCWLAEHSLEQAQPKFRWNMVPKLHYFWHLGKQATDLNPRMSWCYANDDFVCRISTLGMSCRHGQVAVHRSKSLMSKYILGIILRMHHSS